VHSETRLAHIGLDAMPLSKWKRQQLPFLEVTVQKKKDMHIYIFAKKIIKNGNILNMRKSALKQVIVIEFVALLNMVHAHAK